MSTTALDYASAARPAAGRRFARVVPLAFITYSLAFLDRNNYGWGNAQGMGHDLGFSANTDGLIAATFFLGYTALQIPGAGYASRRSVRKLIFWSLFFWGIFSALTGVIRSVPLLIADRFCLGLAEGVVYPSMLIYLNHWFSRHEKSRANAILILGNAVTMTWAQVASGFLIQHFTAHPLWGLKGWQAMFVIEGLPSSLWAFMWLFLASDRPRDARWLTPDEADGVEAMLDAEQRDIKPIRDFRAVLADPRVRLICLQFFFWSVGMYGFSLWLPEVVKVGAGQGMGVTGLLTAIPYLGATLSVLAVSYVSDRTQQRKAFIAPSLLIAAAGFVFTIIVGVQNFAPAFAGLCVAMIGIYAAYGPFWSLLPEIFPRNVAAESIAVINTAGALGGFAGTYLVRWLNGLTGTPIAGFIFLAACLFAAGVLILPLRPHGRTLVAGPAVGST